jgi:hypothetical protein
VRPALADAVRDLLRRIAEFGNQPLISLGLLERMQVLALRVLDRLDLERLLVRQRPHDNRDLALAGELAATPAPLAGDDLELSLLGELFVRMRSREDRLKNAMVLNRLGDLGELVLWKVLAGVRRRRNERREGMDRERALI